MRQLLLGLLLFAWMGTVPAASAEQLRALELLDAKVDYTADYYLRIEGKGEYSGTVVHAPGRERRDYATAKGEQTVLLRRDTGEATMMWPERKWYLVVPLDEATQLAGGLDSLTLERRRDGTETIEGESCTRYEVDTVGDNKAFSGRMWFTKDGIMMKADGLARYQNQTVGIKTGLSHLMRVRAAANAFVPPSDYKGLPLDLAKFGLGGRHQ